MKRRILIHTAITLTLTVICAAWVQSYFFVDELWWPTAQRDFGIEIDRGTIEVFIYPTFPEFGNALDHWSFRSTRRQPEYVFGLDKVRGAYLSEENSYSLAFAGARLGVGRMGFGYRCRWVFVPFWIVCFTLLGLSGPIVVRSERRAWRRRRGLCGKCGYDLRATSERCPECGMVSTGVKP